MVELIMRVEFCGVLRDCVGGDAVDLPLAEPASVAEVLERLAGHYPRLADHLPRVACALGDELIRRDEPVDGGETLVLLPPVSGG